MQSQDANEGFALTPNIHCTIELQSFLFFFTILVYKMLWLEELGEEGLKLCPLALSLSPSGHPPRLYPTP